ncbi:asparagine synthase (glutamine-hydrolyzing) [Gammaproteobacteria bacterium]|nr:asparagine synthase (glutamine-hydrolyzing) [Gammaproteobacteria bacterium]
MCGLAGFISSKKMSGGNLTGISTKMANALISRGPDDLGFYINNQQNLALSFRRLAIQDISSAGKQPMNSPSGRYVICFNGEIYNHLDIRNDILKDVNWKGHSDTETLINLIESLGIEESLKLCTGMFAIAVLDTIESKLYLARDRIGEKPLYYGWTKTSFIFGSELKALKEFPDFEPSISKEALGEFFKYNYVPAPKSIYKNIHKVNPGSFIEIDINNPLSRNTKENFFWDLCNVILESKTRIISDHDEAIKSLEECLDKSVRGQMLSDVPLGAFLSGGVDSSLIASLMQRESVKPIKTFTIGFEDKDFDEAPFARDISKHLGTDHHEHYISSEEAMDFFPEIPKIWDEPFADSSQIPTYFVCKHAKENVTVALSGDGGDEIFGGYNRYLLGPAIWRRLEFLPSSLRSLIGKSIQTLPNNTLDTIGSLYNLAKPKSAQTSDFSYKAKKLADQISHAYDEDSFYKSLILEWRDPAILINNFADTISPKQENFLESSQLNDFASRMMFLDAVTYLPDDILCKVDRAAMSCSLETRAPFLNHELIEKAWMLPLELKIKDMKGKIVLRRILEKYVPADLIDRPKTGFGIPVGKWIKGPLKDWAESLLDPKKIDEQGYLNSSIVSRTWQEHLEGTHDRTSKLWSILMFQSWLEHEKL